MKLQLCTYFPMRKAFHVIRVNGFLDRHHALLICIMPVPILMTLTLSILVLKGTKDRLF